MKRPELDDVTDVEPKRETLRKTNADLRETDADCALVVTPHPYTLVDQRSYSARQAALVPGETLAELLARHGVLAGEQWVVAIGGAQVPELLWPRTTPRPGHLVEARRVPQDNDTLRMGAFIALMVFAPQMAPGWMALYYAGGSFLINKLLPPKNQQFSTPGAAAQPTTYSLSGGRNRARPFEPMALVLGEPYCVPDLAAEPYTYFENGEQYLWQLFHAGINCASVASLRIGQTALANYQNVKLMYEGFAAGNTGLPVLSGNVDTIAGALLDAPASPGAWTTRTSSVNAVQLAVDLESNLYSIDPSSGAYLAAVCEVDVEYRLVGAPAWSVFWSSAPYDVVTPPRYGYGALNGDEWGIVELGYTTTITPTNVRLTSTSTKPVRLTISRNVAPGQYEVRARKITANWASTGASNTVTWSTLKTYQVDNGNYKGQARLGLQIQASGQLNGALDELNWVATAKAMPYWNGAAWVTAVDRASGLCNPGAQILLLARGIYDVDGRLLAGYGFADAQIDIAALQGFMVWCAAKNFYFDLHLQQVMSTGDLMDAIAYAGLGAISWHTGKLGVIWFADDQPIESVLNMGTIKAKTFSVDYDTQTTADELEFQYFDRARGNAWKSLRVTAPGVVTPQNTGRVPMLGIIFEAHSAILARFAMAQNIYQRKTVGAAVDLEHLTFRRGTVMALSHDLTQWGYGGRVQAAVNNAGTVTLTLDDVVPAVGPTGQITRYMGLRIPGESQYRIFSVAAFVGSSRTLTLATAWPGGVAVPGDSAGNPAWDTIWIYDFKATPGQKLRVASVEPQGNMGGARVALVPESPEFWTYVWTGAYTPPSNTSLLQGKPVCTGAQVSEELARQGNTFYTELTATIKVTGSYDHAELWGSVGGVPKRLLATSRSQALHWRGGLSEEWWLEVRVFSSISEGTSFALRYLVAGLSVKPANVAPGTATPVGALLELDWPDNTTDVDLAVYEVRAADAGWGSEGYLYRDRAPSARVLPPAPLSSLLAYVKARDSSGNYSVAATQISFTAAAVPNPAILGHSFAGSSTTGATFTLNWTDVAPQFGLRTYEVSYAGIVKTVKANTITVPADWLGDRDFVVKTVEDGNGAKSSGVTYSVTKLAPNSPTNFSSYAIDSTGVFSWGAPAPTTLPISHYLLKKGATYAGATPVGRVDKTFDSCSEPQAGTAIYWLVAVDTDGRESAPVQSQLTVFQPPDYILAANWLSDFSGTKSNAIVEQGMLVLPVNTTETFAQHFTNNAWATPQAQIDAGFPLFIQPGAGSGYYEEVHDYGTVLASMAINVLVSLETMGGTVGYSVVITVALDAGFTTGVKTFNGTTAYTSNFRYVKVRVTVTATDNHGIGRIPVGGLITKLDAKLKTEQGTASMSLGGAYAQGNVAPETLGLWVPGMAMPPAGFTLNGAAAKNIIVSALGPSGVNEPLWACVDNDVALGADGGWDSSYSAADLATVGHLVACFMKESTVAGTSYFGTSTDGSILDLAGTVNNNPYFWQGDLPALNTWYLLVGYVHPIGYGAVDTGLAGVYNLAGTRLVAGTEFKANAGAAQLKHRAYHNDNATNSGAQVQWMTRPVVIPCPEAAAAGKITYLLQCAQQYGAAVRMPTDVVDVINPWAQAIGLNVGAGQVDFVDKPNPHHMNVFILNAGNLVAGDASYGYRRY